MDRNVIFKWLLFGSEIYEQFKCFSGEVINEYFSIQGLDNVHFREENTERFINGERLKFINDKYVFIDFPVSDYINEIHAVCGSHLLINSSDSIKMNDTYLSVYGQLNALIYLAKMDISILENGAVYTDNPIIEDLFCRYIDAIDQYIKYLLIDNESLFRDELFGRIILYNTQIKEQIYGRKSIDKLINEIEDWMKLINENREMPKNQIRTISKDIWGHIRSMVFALGSNYGIRYYLIKRIIGHFKLYKLFSKTEKLLMSVSNDIYVQNRDILIKEIIYKIENLQNFTSQYNYGETFHFMKDIELVTELFSSTTRKDLLSVGIAQYWNKKPCFGIMQIVGGESLFSLSGSYDYSGRKFSLTSNSKTYNINYLGRKVEEITKLRWARLNDNVLRYTCLSTDNDYLRSPIEVINDLELQSDIKNLKNNLGSSYGCCERKLQAANGNDFSSDKLFFVKYAPCNKCRPAIYHENENCYVWALCESSKQWVTDDFKFLLKNTG